MSMVVCDMNYNDAKLLVQNYVAADLLALGTELHIYDELTVTKSYGWVIHWDSKKFVDSGDNRFRLVGNGPLLVLISGEIVQFGTGMPFEYYLEKFERENGLLG